MGPEAHTLPTGIARVALYVGKDGAAVERGELYIPVRVHCRSTDTSIFACRKITYSGSYNATGPGYLAVYGWTRNPLIEYYIIESHADLAPNEPWTSKGNFTFDEGTYEIFTSTRVNKPSIVGTATFQQYWSVRSEKRVGGTVTTGTHFQEWSKLGMQLGSHDYVILATEGYTADGGPGSSGSSSITLA